MVVGVSGLDGHNALSSVERAYKLVTGHVTQHLTTACVGISTRARRCNGSICRG